MALRYKGKFVSERKMSRLSKTQSKVKQKLRKTREHDYARNFATLPFTQDDLGIKYGAKISANGWREGRRIIEWPVLLKNLEFCTECRLGPLILTMQTIKGEMPIGLSGYLYVKCQNPECEHINSVAYGQTHRPKLGKQGMPCFVVNTKLGHGKSLYFYFCSP